MTFKTLLSKALDIRDSCIVVDDYIVEDDMLWTKDRDGFLDPKDPRRATLIKLDMSVYDYGEFTFPDQIVEVDSDGYFVASDDEGEDFSFRVTVQRPITEADL